MSLTQLTPRVYTVPTESSSLSIPFFYVACSPIAGYGLLVLEAFRDHTQRHTTFGRTPLEEWSARRRNLYLTTHNTHNRQTSMSPAGFEPTISAGERPQTYALDRAATGTGYQYRYYYQNYYHHILNCFLWITVCSAKMFNFLPLTLDC